MLNAVIRTITLSLIILILVSCGPSRTYTTGPLSTDYRVLPREALVQYDAKLAQEQARVEAGGALPEGVDRGVYSDDLVRRRKDVARELERKKIWDDEERRSHWWPSS